MASVLRFLEKTTPDLGESRGNSIETTTIRPGTEVIKGQARGFWFSSTSPACARQMTRNSIATISSAMTSGMHFLCRRLGKTLRTTSV